MVAYHMLGFFVSKELMPCFIMQTTKIATNSALQCCLLASVGKSDMQVSARCQMYVKGQKKRNMP